MAANLAITTIRLQNFRSYSDAQFTFGNGPVIIVGPNASGKTNLLEAIHVVARGSSFRAKDQELVRFEHPWARLDAQTTTGQRTVKLQSNNGVSKQFIIDDQTLVRLTYQRTLPVVLFEPNHLLLLSSSPDLRRTFLDDLIEQLQPGFGAVRRHYKRVLAQRNALLKKNPPNLAQQLFVWNVRLGELGGKIAHERFGLIERFGAQINSLYSDLAHAHTKVEIHYASRFPIDTYETTLLKKLEESEQMDVLRGFTAYGPHRDDMALLLNGHAVQETASRGETRTLVLALKILELQLLETVRHTTPLLLLDDVFSELDAARRQALTGFVQHYQTFITTTDADAIAPQLHASTVIKTD